MRVCIHVRGTIIIECFFWDSLSHNQPVVAICQRTQQPNAIEFIRIAEAPLFFEALPQRTQQPNLTFGRENLPSWQGAMHLQDYRSKYQLRPITARQGIAVNLLAFILCLLLKIVWLCGKKCFSWAYFYACGCKIIYFSDIYQIFPQLFLLKVKNWAHLHELAGGYY